MAFQKIMHTSTPNYNCAFSWKIDDFSTLKVQGPTFTPIPGNSRKFCFELKFRDVYKSRSPMEGRTRSAYLNVELICFDDKDLNLYVAAYIRVRNRRYKNLTNDAIDRWKTGIVKVEKATYLGSYRRHNLSADNLSDRNLPLQFMGFKDNKVTLEGTLKFSSYSMTSSIYSLPVQQPSKNCDELTKDLKTMYESGLGSDFTFFVGKEKLRAHKTILLGRSPVFAKMFEHDMLENNTNSVTIEDFDSHTFNCFLMFLYTDVVQDDKYETVMSLYSVAQKYHVKSLQKACSVLLVKQLSVEYVCRILVLADLHNDVELECDVTIFIRENL